MSPDLKESDNSYKSRLKGGECEIEYGVMQIFKGLVTSNGDFSVNCFVIHQ